ncbi:MAG: hypothetical protein methR_P2237 [Methyloprofundus sp.]|nr:MAG: hypothetical protein methR_P2237 [Methyloprofundus sp.]
MSEHVHQLDEWDFIQRHIDKLPFKYATKVIKKKRKEISLLKD